MSQPKPQTSAFVAAVGQVSISVPQGYALSVLFRLDHTEAAGDVYYYWVAVGEWTVVRVDYDGSRVLRVDVPSSLIQEVSTPQLQAWLAADTSLPPGPPIIRPSGP